MCGIAFGVIVAFVAGCAEDKSQAQRSAPGEADAREVSAASETSTGQAREQSRDPAQAPAKAEAGEGDTQQGEARHERTTQRQAEGSDRRRARRGQEALNKHDENKDGKLSKEEFKAGDRAFDRLDTDGDGALTQGEFTGAAQRARQGRPSGAALMEMTDKDGDARISRDEWRGLFDEADTNSDGFMTGEEVTNELRQGAPHPQPRRAR